MTETVTQTLFQAVTETLENMAFVDVLPEPAPENGEDQQGERLTASLLIHDPVQGELRLDMPVPLLRALGETVFAMPAEELGESVPKDLLAEILNTIAGVFLTRLLPQDQPYRLGLPELESPPMEEISASHTWFFTIEGMPFSLSASGENLLDL